MPREADKDAVTVTGMNLWLPIVLAAAGIIGTAYVGKYRLEANERMDERDHAEFRVGISQLKDSIAEYRSGQSQQMEMMKQILDRVKQHEK